MEEDEEGDEEGEEEEEEEHPRACIRRDEDDVDDDVQYDSDDEESIVLQFETSRHAFLGAPLKGSRERPVVSVLQPDPVPSGGWWF